MVDGPILTQMIEDLIRFTLALTPLIVALTGLLGICLRLRGQNQHQESLRDQRTTRKLDE